MVNDQRVHTNQPPEAVKLYLELYDEWLGKRETLTGYYSAGAFFNLETHRAILPKFITGWSLFDGDNLCPVDVTNAVRLSPDTGNDSNPTPPSSLDALILALTKQTEALNRMANSIAMLAQVIADQQDGDEESETYMDGTPRKR